MNRVCILMSTNHEPEANLRACLAALREQTSIQAISKVYETEPVGEIYTEKFLDAIVLLETNHAPVDFREQVLLPIEKRLGRVKGTPTIPIDLDILLWNTDSFDFGYKPWHVPDADIVRDIHLAHPLAELLPDYVHPEDGRTLREIAASLPHDGLILRPDITLE